MKEYILDIYKNIHKGTQVKWYSLEETKNTCEKVTIKYLEEDVNDLIKLDRGWDEGWVLQKLVTKQIHREGREKIKRKLL